VKVSHLHSNLSASRRTHDLRHTGNTLAAATGASTRELMHRMGHASVRAALIYQHATQDRDREIADALSKRIAQAAKAKGKKGGTRGADQTA
jgi:integrase